MSGTDLPVARVAPVTDDLFGVVAVDPYRWMEDDGAELDEWLAGQAAHTDATLAALPDRAALAGRIAELTHDDVRAADFEPRGDLVFHRDRVDGADVPVLVVADGTSRRVLLDPATLPGGARSNLDWFAPSHDGKHVACGISTGGAEIGTLRVLDVATGELSDDGAPRVFFGGVSWLPDDAGFVYHRYADVPPETPPAARRSGSGTFLHWMGTAFADDVPVLAPGTAPSVPLEPKDRPYVVVPSGSDVMVAVVSHAASGSSLTQQLRECSVYVAPLPALTDPATCAWRAVATPADEVTGWALHGRTLYLVTHAGDVGSHVVSVPVDDPVPADATVVVPPGERSAFSVHVVGDQLLVRDIVAGRDELRQVPLAGGDAVEVPLPFPGSIVELTTDDDTAVLVLQSWTRSPAALRYNPATGELTDTGWIEPSPVDLSAITTTEIEVPARDGTLVPLAILHTEGLELDGERPTLLSGYGSYGLVTGRRFSPELLAWCERGRVIAYAGLRGGGDHGPAWHAAGKGANKENTINDFVDCAEYLVAQGYTRPAKLAGSGGSAGGIPTGGAIVRRPELWAAMVMQVPVTNTTRMEYTENGPVNVPEFGTSTTEQGARDLLITDSYLRVTDGVAYPAVLLTAGRNDARVTVWQPGKMAARLQAATASDPARRPVLLRVDYGAGHGQGMPHDLRVALLADTYAFVLAAMRE
ncbi:MAG TPA: prolyl oligopeptidase family serine peptidase [Pseudonocardiaceae bacterium]|jgi:prolyl oligopeptidase|nr:prolyl oligopeptidase family serine peptidase [Pseudonocardiaceae bacterium]